MARKLRNAITVLPDELSGLFPEGISENPADFIPDPAGRPNHVLYLPSCELPPRSVTQAGNYRLPNQPENTPDLVAFEAPEGSGNLYQAQTGVVYNVHPTVYEYLTGIPGEGSDFVPSDRGVTITMQRQIDAQQAEIAALKALIATQAPSTPNV